MEFDELEKKVMADMRRIYTDKTIDHAMRPRNLGRIKDADGYARVTGLCGDTMEMYLKIRGERVADSTFWTDGCGTTIACGSLATELIKGKSVTESLRIDSDCILNALGGLPESDVHCSVLASEALRAAIRNYLASKNKRVSPKSQLK